MLKERNRRRMIIFARENAPKNAFELTIAALSECVRLRILDTSEWEFVGIGGSSSKPICNLGERKEVNACIRMIQNLPEYEYRKLLIDADIGLSITLSPNPSFTVFDFAAAGMIVVTNSFETRKQEDFDKISHNFIAAKSSLNGIIEGISKALLMIEQGQKETKLNLPTNWNDERCYGKDLMDKVKNWFNDGSLGPFQRETA